MSPPAPAPTPARVLLFTGKGGVGKTTVSAATALACAEAGLRTMVLSTDPAHSLSDAFGVPLSATGAPVADRLWGQQLDATARMADTWEDIRRWLAAVFRWAGLDAVEADELSVLPGVEEVLALADIRTWATSGAFDVVVVDCAPTAETLRLLSLPDVLRVYMDRLFGVTRRLNRAVAPALGRITDLPVADDAVFAATERLYRRLAAAKELLADPDRTSVRLVVNAERMVVAEARRTATYLGLYGYGLDAVIVNRILPDEVADPWFASWKSTQATQLAEIETAFAPVPVLTVPLAPDEVVGTGALRELAGALWAGTDPVAVLHRAETMRVRAAGDRRVLEIHLPFAEGDVDVVRVGDELVVTVGGHRRAIVLPDSLRRLEVTRARLRSGRLEVELAPGP